VQQALHPIHAAGHLVDVGQDGQAIDEGAGARAGGGLRCRRDLDRRRQRIAGQLIDDGRVLAQRAAKDAQRLRLVHVVDLGDARHGLHALHEGGRVGRLALEVHDDPDAIAPLTDGTAQIGGQQTEGAQRTQGERDEHDRAHGRPAAAAEVAHGLAEEESKH